MATLSSTLNNTWHKETLLELEYLISELVASTEFALLAIVICGWLFLRLYWLGLCLIAYFAGYKIG